MNLSASPPDGPSLDKKNIVKEIKEKQDTIITLLVPTSCLCGDSFISKCEMSKFLFLSFVFPP
jgi:hypothetical protein